MMEYKNNLIAELTQLENYARTCFVIIMKLPNGQDQRTNTFIDKFMQDLTTGELPNSAGNQITLDECLYGLLPNCRNAVNAQSTLLFNIVADWIHDNLFKCQMCGLWYLQDKYHDGYCDDCFEHLDESTVEYK